MSQKPFEVGACIKLWVGTTVTAASLEDAVLASKKLTISNFVKILHNENYNDGSLKIIQVFDPDFSVEVDG